MPSLMLHSSFKTQIMCKYKEVKGGVREKKGTNLDLPKFE